MPQGTLLGPLMFLCHINDLPDCVKSQVRLFADDCLIYRQIKIQKDHQILQNDLKELEKWAAKWGMRFNAKKCYISATNFLKRTHRGCRCQNWILPLKRYRYRYNNNSKSMIQLMWYGNQINVLSNKREEIF